MATELSMPDGRPWNNFSIWKAHSFTKTKSFDLFKSLRKNAAKQAARAALEPKPAPTGICECISICIPLKCCHVNSLCNKLNISMIGLSDLV